MRLAVKPVAARRSGSERFGPYLAAALLVLAGFGASARAEAEGQAPLKVRPALTGVEGLEPRLKALERRVESLERELKEKDAQIERLREGLDRRDAAPEPEPPGERQDWPFGWRPDQFGDLHERMRREIEKWGLERGLPGREGRPEVRPRSAPKPPRPGEGPRELEALRPLRRAFLGIEMRDVPGGGVAVRRVVLDSPAERAGLAAGDELVAIDGHPVATPREVVAIVGAHEPGDEIELRIRRAGETLTVKAKLARPEAEKLLPMPRWRLGPPARPKPQRLRRWPGQPRRRGGGDGERDRQRDAAKAGDLIEVEVDVPGGRASVSVSAPGLYLSEQIAGGLDLTEAERRDVEDAFARARDRLARSLSEAVAGGDGNLDAGAVGEKRLEAERHARRALAGRLPEEKLRSLERAQAKVASRSRVSISVKRGVERRRRVTPPHPGRRPRREPETMPPDEMQEF